MSSLFNVLDTFFSARDPSSASTGRPSAQLNTNSAPPSSNSQSVTRTPSPSSTVLRQKRKIEGNAPHKFVDRGKSRKVEWHNDEGNSVSQAHPAPLQLVERSVHKVSVYGSVQPMTLTNVKYRSRSEPTRMVVRRLHCGRIFLL